MSETDIAQMQAAIDAAIEQGRELMRERRNSVNENEGSVGCGVGAVDVDIPALG